MTGVRIWSGWQIVSAGCFVELFVRNKLFCRSLFLLHSLAYFSLTFLYGSRRLSCYLLFFIRALYVFRRTH